jgi:hypothetical protein
MCTSLGANIPTCFPARQAARGYYIGDAPIWGEASEQGLELPVVGGRGQLRQLVDIAHGGAMALNRGYLLTGFGERGDKGGQGSPVSRQ